MFKNSQIEIANLPNVESINLLKLHPKLKIRSLVNRCLFSLIFIIGMIVIYIFTPLFVFMSISLPIVIILIVNIIWPFISYEKKAFAVREHDIIYLRGVLWKSFKAIPFNRLQHIELTRSPFDRVLGLATLVFYTAGGSYGDLNISGFAHQDAQKIRAQILKILNKDASDQSE